MQEDKVKINLSGISRTLLTPLWERAQFSKEHSSLFNDPKAIEIVDKLDYDFPMSPQIPFLSHLSLLFAARAKQFDDAINAYIIKHPRASLVNIGCGLDTTFYRIDNGFIHWYDLDLPRVIELRKQLIPETERSTCIAKSILDPTWCKDLRNTDDGVFMIAGGVLMYFEESMVTQFFSLIADNLAGGEIVFDAPSKLDDDFEIWMKQLSQEQREELSAAWGKALKGWWQRASQDRKDELIAALKSPTKPRGTEWIDFKTWWEELSNEGKEEALHAFRSPSHREAHKWALEDADELVRWDNRITVIDRFPLFQNIPRDPSLSIAIRKFMDYSDEHSMLTIFHFRV
jgi:O-methyltransferase involved in polyketide biosynthesis